MRNMSAQLQPQRNSNCLPPNYEAQGRSGFVKDCRWYQDSEARAGRDKSVTLKLRRKSEPEPVRARPVFRSGYGLGWTTSIIRRWNPRRPRGSHGASSKGNVSSLSSFRRKYIVVRICWVFLLTREGKLPTKTNWWGSWETYFKVNEHKNNSTFVHS